MAARSPTPVPPMLSPACLLAAACAGGVASGPGDAREPVVAPRPTAPAADRLDELVDRLGDADYARRSAADAALRAAGAAAVPALTRAGRSDDPERRTRAVAALAAGHAAAVRRGDRAGQAAFFDALLGLAHRHPPGVRVADEPPPPPADAARAAAAAIDRFPQAVGQRSVAVLRERGAAVMGPASRFGPGLTAVQVTLDDRWTGGADGLLYLRVVPKVQTLYLTENADLPPAARVALRAGGYGTFPVEPRGEAFFGITFDAAGGGGGCEVGEVHPGSPAERAGLRSGDVVKKFGETDVTGPGVLLDAIREQGVPGEPVPVLVGRLGRDDRVVEVTLGRWPDGDRLPPRRRLPMRFNPVLPPPASPPAEPPAPRAPGDDTDD